MRLADLTIRSLQDKSSQVRKNCIALLTKLILTHPYGRMHGGELSTTAWEARYNALCAQLEPLDLPSAEEAEARANAIEMMRDDDEDMAATPVEAALDVEEVVEKEEAGEEEGEGEDDESGDDDDPKLKKSKVAKGKGKPRKSDGIDLAAADQSQLLASVDSETLTRLRLIKNYYADAIAFIAQLDRAMLLLADLLASKVKSEVLEAMEFFTVAFEYKIEAAEVRNLPHPLSLTKLRSACDACFTSSGPRTRSRRRRTARRSRASAPASPSVTRSSTLSRCRTSSPRSRLAAWPRMSSSTSIPSTRAR